MWFSSDFHCCPGGRRGLLPLTRQGEAVTLQAKNQPDFMRKVARGPDRNFLVAHDNLSTINSPAGALTGFKRFPDIRDPALKSYHELLESTYPALISLSQVFPDGH